MSEERKPFWAKCPDGTGATDDDKVVDLGKRR